MRWRHADLAAGPAVGRVVRGVHTSAVAGRLHATGQRAQPVFADLSRATDFAAGAAILRIGLGVDAVARTLIVATIAIHRALSTTADCDAVGGGRADSAACAAIVEVRLELLAPTVASAVAGRAAQGTDRALANCTRVGCARTGLPAIAAVCRVGREIDAGSRTIARSAWTVRGALAARAHLVLLAFRAAGAAVGRILIGLHARGAALRVADVADRSALACIAGRGAVGGRVADVFALSAVRWTVKGIHAARPALLEALGAAEVTGRVGAQRVAMVGTGTGRVAVSAMARVFAEVEAGAVAIAQRSFATCLAPTR